jgi:hypothetical protein
MPSEPHVDLPVEARWPPALALVVVVVLASLLPEQVAVLTPWLARLVCGAVLLAMAAAVLSGEHPVWRRLERRMILGASGTYVVVIAAELADMMGLVALHPGGVNAFSLLSTAVVIWLGNVTLFSLLYWQLDRGGPYARRTKAGVQADWAFPRPDDPDDLVADSYVDYLFLAYNTATAFSPADAVPLTSRAKLLMMVESLISMLTLVVVVSRAINVLPD